MTTLVSEARRPPPPPISEDERTFGSWRLVARLTSGDDGTAYLAEGASGLSVVHHLSRARRNPARWEAIGFTLAKRRLLAHSGLVPLLELDLDARRPYLVTPYYPRSLLDLLPIAEAELLGVATQVLEAVVAAHRIGLALGTVIPSRIRMDSAGRPLVDGTGLRTAAPLNNLLEEACALPPRESVSLAADVHALGALLPGMAVGDDTLVNAEKGPLASPLLAPLLEQARAFAPEDRPSVRELADAVALLIENQGTIDADPFAKTDRGITSSDSRPGSLEALVESSGRYALLGRLGQGSMGAVFKAEDRASGQLVALKVLNDKNRQKGGRARKRFMKEARLLSELRNPYIANLLEVNFDDRIDWMAMELKEGRDLHHFIHDHGPLPLRAALEVLLDVTRGLVDAHRQGIIHRDIKPANILILDDKVGKEPRTGPDPVACLVDFGIARHVEESESLDLTRDGGIVGTPMYLSPEQAGAGAVGPYSDIYALGCTLFHFLVGRPPFLGVGAMELIGKHLGMPPPRADEENEDVDEATADLVARMLEKKPKDRFQDAGELLRAVEHLLGKGTADDIEAHPRLPAGDHDGVRTYVFEWDLASPPNALWPYVSDTDRLNRAVGLSAVDVEHRVVGKNVLQFARMQVAGLSVVWREHPFEWIENKRFGILREFEEGPFAWLRSTVDLTSTENGGCHLVHRFDLMPRGVMGKAAAALEVNFKGRRGLDKVYRRIDELLKGGALGRGMRDAFEADKTLSPEAERRLAAGERKLVNGGCDPNAVLHLGELLRTGDAKSISHIRPLVFARQFALDDAAALEVCLHAVGAGLLTLHWDLLCPVCKVASDIQDTLAALRDHGRCQACNLDYELDLAGSVELVLRVHPQIRTPDVQTYCASSPGHSPHVKARVRVAPGERLKLELALEEGRYLFAGRGLPYEIAFRIQRDGGAHRWDLDLDQHPPAGLARSLRPGHQEIVLVNSGDEERVVRIERLADRDDAFTAARAASHWLFRKLFPEQRLDDGQIISIKYAALVAVELFDSEALWAQSDDEHVYAVLSRLFTLLDGHFAEHGGALVKIRRDGALGVFLDPAAAVAAALSAEKAAREVGLPASLRLRAAVHQGPSHAITLNGRLDYFGSIPRGVEALVAAAGRGEVLLSQEIATDPASSRVLDGREADITGVPTGGLGLRVAT